MRKLKSLNKQPIETQRFMWKSGMLMAFIVINLLLGSTLNFVAMRSNGMRMPSFFGMTDSEHITFVTFDDPNINLIYLTDILIIGNYVYSIGDVLIYLTPLFDFVFLIWFLSGIRRQVWLKN